MVPMQRGSWAGRKPVSGMKSGTEQSRKHASESKWGKHSRSTAPSSVTSAAVRRLPISAWPSMSGVVKPTVAASITAGPVGLLGAEDSVFARWVARKRRHAERGAHFPLYPAPRWRLASKRAAGALNIGG
jgi:hypothetical protein